jgi:hypothetical protein
MPKEMREHAFELEFRQTVSELDRLSKLDGPLQAPRDVNILAVLSDRGQRRDHPTRLRKSRTRGSRILATKTFAAPTAIHNDRGWIPQLNPLIHRHHCSIDQLVGFTEMFNDTDWRATTGGINFSVLVTALSTENWGDVSQLLLRYLSGPCQFS